MAGVETASCVKGTAYSGEHLTLIDCHSPGTGHTSSKDAPTRYHADVFPHYVAVGRRHLEPGEACISAIHFTTTDLTTLFYDFDAFSHVIDAKPIIDVVLQERRQMRPVEAGELPHVFYFTGKDCIAEVPTAIGKVSVHHRPRYSMGGPTGVFIKNRIVLSIEPEQPVAFHDSIDRMYQVGCFLSMAAGRTQGVDHVHVTTTEVTDGIPQLLTICPHHYASWLGLSPNNKITGGRVFSTKSLPRPSPAALALRLAAQSLRSSKSALGDRFRRLRARLGAPKAITALAHLLAKLIYRGLTRGQAYLEDGLAALQDQSQTNTLLALHQRRAHRLGYELTPLQKTA